MGKSSGGIRNGKKGVLNGEMVSKYAELSKERAALYDVYIKKRNQLESEGKDTLLATEKEYKRLYQISMQQALMESKIANDIPFSAEKRNKDPRVIAFRKAAKKKLKDR